MKMQEMESNQGKMKIPLLIIETRDYCKLVSENEACKHCSVDSYLIRSKCKETPNWSEVIRQFSEIGYTPGHVVLKNGAAALGTQELSILEQALKKGLSVSVTTEGAHIPSDFEKRVMELGREHQGKLGVTVSLDGHTPELYGQLRKDKDFGRTIGFIKRINSEGLDTGVNYVVHAGNVNEIKDYVDFVVNELGVGKVNFLELNLTGGARKNNLEVADSETYLNILIDTYAEGNEKVKSALRGTFAAAIEECLGSNIGCKGCPAGSEGMFHVNNKGDIFPCSSLELEQYNVGNVTNISLSEAMESIQFAYARKVAESASATNSIVSMCPGRLESFGELGHLDKATALTKNITNYLAEKGIDVSEVRQISNRCYSPAF